MASSEPRTDDRPPAGPRYRSGTVARMLGMPVATLRVWERRYAVVAPPLSGGGHRLYDDADVARLGLLKRLVDGGHAIGTLAGLPQAQLWQAAAHALPPAQHAAAGRARAVAAVGPALATRLQAAGAAPACAHADTLGETAAWPTRLQADLLLVQLPSLQSASGEAVLALARRLGAQHTVLLYGYAAAPTLQALRSRGVRLRREPVGPAELAELIGATGGGAPLPPPRPPDAGAAAPPEAVLPRRYDDATLAGIAQRSPAMACECPRHIAELLMQLSGFETYSAECGHRSPADALLHAELGRVAGRARALFEHALEQVARAEGIALPAPQPP